MDISAVETLGSLEGLSLHLPPKPPISLDLGKLTSLRVLEADWNLGFRRINAAIQLEELTLNGIRGLKVLDLSGMSRLRALRVVASRSLQSIILTGAGRLEQLELINLSDLETVIGFEAGSVVQNLVARNLGKLDRCFFKNFTALDLVEVAPGEGVSKEDFGRPPRALISVKTHVGLPVGPHR